MHIHRLRAADIRTQALPDLCELLRDAVSGGASVGWVAVPSLREAAAYWQGVADQVQRGAVVMLGAQESPQLIGA